MTRTLVIHATVTVEGEREPEFVVTYRLPWPDGQSLEDVTENLFRRACLELHAPKLKVSLA